MAVTLHQESPVILKHRTALKSFIPQIFKKEGKALESLNVIFCSDDYLLEVNQSFLDHDYYTDIITFDLSETKTGPVTGELYISVDRVKDNACTLNVSFDIEIHRVIFHGILHLCGYKDKAKKDIKVIREKENLYLDLYFKNRP